MGFWEIFGEDCFCRRPPPFGHFMGLDGPTIPAWRFFGAALFVLPFAWMMDEGTSTDGVVRRSSAVWKRTSR